MPAPLEKIYGKHSVRAVFLTRGTAIRRMILLGGKPLGEFENLAKQAGIRPEILPREDFVRAGNFADDENHQGVCVFAAERKIFSEKELPGLRNARAVLVLDQISDPRNLGSILRSAAFFGVDAVIWMKNRAAELEGPAVRIAVGGAEFTRLFRVPNLARALEILKKMGFWVYGLDERGERTLAETDWDEKIAFVVGAEGEGLRLRTGKFCDELVRIPGGRRGLESLNASVATAVALGEIFRGGPRGAGK